MRNIECSSGTVGTAMMVGKMIKESVIIIWITVLFYFNAINLIIFEILSVTLKFTILICSLCLDYSSCYSEYNKCF